MKKGCELKIKCFKTTGDLYSRDKNLGGGVDIAMPEKYFLHYYVVRSPESITVKHIHVLYPVLTHPCGFVKSVLV